MEKKNLRFRAWNKISKRMVRLDGLNWFNGFTVSYMRSIMRITKDSKDFEIMQYTGLKDSQRKEIWEGDILRRRSTKTGRMINWIVTWQYMEFCLRADYLDNPNYYYQRLDYSPQGKVIGNIYENSELLK